MGSESSISYRNLFYMIMYNQNIYNKLTESKNQSENYMQLLDFQADILCGCIRDMLNNGLLNKFNSHLIETDRPRGSIDIQQQAKNGLLGKANLACKVNQVDINTHCNMIIKAAINRLLILNRLYKNHEIQNKNIRRLRYFKDLLYDVSDITSIRGIRLLSTLELSQKYRQVYSIQLVILKNFLVSSQSGRENLLDIKDKSKIHEIYQNFVASFYKKKLQNKGLEVTSQESIEWKSMWDNQISTNLRPDCIIKDKLNKRILIIDTKWYNNEADKSGENLKIGINNSEIGKSVLYGMAFKENKDYKDYEICQIVLMAKNIKTGEIQWAFHRNICEQLKTFTIQVIHHSMSKSFQDIENDLLNIANVFLTEDLQKKPVIHQLKNGVYSAKSAF